MNHTNPTLNSQPSYCPLTLPSHTLTPSHPHTPHTPHTLTQVRHSSIELQRLESIARSPIYASFSEVLGGLTTVRAYGDQKRFCEKQGRMLNRHLQPFFFVRTVIPAWLQIRLNLLAGCITVVVVTTIVVRPSLLPSGMAGLSITYCNMLTQMLFFVVFITTEAEVQMNSVERIKHYAENIPEEAPDEILPGPPESWPATGVVDFDHYRAGYQQGPDVLIDLTLRIRAREKVGVVGRTGSGKSTMLAALFRIVEARSGRILIDGLDTSTLGLRQLRSRLGIIPQDPVLFTGTVRFNLDPFDLYKDDVIWSALEQVRIIKNHT